MPPRRGDFLALRHCRHRDFPPATAGLGRPRRRRVDRHHVGAVRRAGARQRRLELRDRARVLGVRAERARVRGEVDRGRRAAAVRAVVEQIVERRPAHRLLQPADAAVAAVVEDDDRQLAAEHHRGGDLGVEHQVAAVADDDDHFATGVRHLHADAAGNLVAHARVAVLDVIAAGHRRAPELVQLARQRPRGADDDVVAGRVGDAALDRADHLAVVGQRHRAHAGDAQHLVAPALAALLRGRLPRGIGAPAAERPRQRREPATGVGAHRQAAPLERVERVDVDRHEPRLHEQRIRSGGEVLQPCADRNHHVGLARCIVRGGRAGDADRAQLQRVVPRQRALAGLGLRDGHAMRVDERTQRVRRLRIEHAAACDDQWTLRRADRLGGCGHLFRRRAASRRTGPAPARRTPRASRRPSSARPAAARASPVRTARRR